MVSASILTSTVGFISFFVTAVFSQQCNPFGECRNGGDCNNNNVCNCNGDWFGILCQHRNTEPCSGDGECRNGGNCNGNRVCECRKYWYGRTCEIVCPGEPTLCQNGGTCIKDNQVPDGFRCNCVNQYMGKYCENGGPLTCLMGLCLNGGNPDERFSDRLVCMCPPTHTGPCCQDLTGCNPPCLNGGICTTGGSCDCPSDWVGPQCQDPVNGMPPPSLPCDSSPCSNGGTCTDVLGTNQFMCNCPPPYTGDTCEASVPTTPSGGSQPGGGGQQQQQLHIITIIIAAVGGIVALIVFIACCFLVICCCCYRSGMHTSSNKSQRMTAVHHVEEVEEGRSNNIPLHQNTYIELKERNTMEFPRVNLRLLEHIGSGSFAEVYKAKAYSIITPKKMTTVAVKVLKENASDNDRKDFMKELSLCKTLGRHENVVNTLGCCTGKEPVYLIMEYLNKGNLQQHLRNLGKENTASSHSYMNTTSGNHLAPSELLKFGIDIASGMEFIDSKKCIHRDLAARNVLLGRDMRCKISDFGLARDVTESAEYEMKSKSRVPVRWMAPESLMQNIYTTKSDAWSFGIVMWEIITLGSHPYPGMSPRQVMEGVLNGYRLPRPDHCGEEIYSKVEKCWEPDPADRPSFTQIKADLEEIMEIDQGYLQMDHFNQGDYIYLEPDAEAEEEL